MKTKNEKVCLIFATTLAKQKGITYTQATKKYPKGYNVKSVYVNATDILEAHCVHCARAEALGGASK